MYKKAQKWDTKAIILVALIGIIMGVAYVYLFNNLYNLLKLALLPIGLAPIVDSLASGLWYMAAPLAIYFVPVIGAGAVGETIAAIVEMALGGQWGVLTIAEGLLQGIANEIGFFPVKRRYEKFSWPSLLIGAVGAHLAGFFPSFFLFGWNHYAMNLQIAMFVAGLASAIVFDAVLVKLITKLFDQALGMQNR